ncbi:YcgL domain-containing protein [Algibacillus agarilyticus]|uniref:YcgL domain-containing protein n=1 Tax=Algibacillus agarilyticus TaxID=2234133 RepID=UPI000DCFC610|nr:YcgL domain-containing protein [Algibacillus agarilyticus]
MLSAVYKSLKKIDTYLFIEQRDDFSKVPEPLLAMFGTAELVTVLNLSTKDRLGIADINKVRAELAEKGFYLQIPPPPENLLKEHLAKLKEQGKLSEKYNK